MTSPYDTPTLAAVVAARGAQDHAEHALDALLAPDQRPALEALLTAVEERYRAGYWHLATRLAELLPGSGPAIRELAEAIEWRIDHAPPATS